MYSLPIVFSLVSAYLLLLVGIGRIKRARSKGQPGRNNHPYPLIQILVPLKGVSDQSKEILETLLTQNYPNYRVTFILENEFDPAFGLVKEFCSAYGHVELFLSGTASQCGQKNFGLAKAVSQLQKEVEILVFLR